MFFLVVLFVYYSVENRRRDRTYGLASQVTSAEEVAEDISNKTDREIPHFRYVL